MYRASAWASAFALTLGTGLLSAAPVATITESVNQVAYGVAGSAHATPAPVGTSLGDGDFLKTGAGSRAELQFPNQSVTRLGANTIFNYSAASNEIDLQSGTILFSKTKDGKEMEIKTAAITAAIVGTTGFAQIHTKNHHTSYLIGIIEGKAVGNADGKSFPIHAGEILFFQMGSTPTLFGYDLPRLVHTSPLILKFHHGLPNQSFIDKAIAKYENDVRKGFILPGTGPTGDFYSVEIPAIPTVARDSAGNRLQQVTNPPPPMMDIPPAAPTPPPGPTPPP